MALDNSFGLWDLDDGSAPKPDLGDPSTLAWLQSGDLMTSQFSDGFQVWDGADFELIGSTDDSIRWSAFAVSPDHRFGVVAGHFLDGEAA